MFANEEEFNYTFMYIILNDMFWAIDYLGLLIRLIVSHLRNTHVNCTGANWISVSRPVITIYLSTKWKHFILYIYMCDYPLFLLFFPFACMQNHWFGIWFVNIYTTLNWVWCTMKIQQNFNLLRNLNREYTGIHSLPM